MSVEVITAAKHEYMYEELNESPETDEDKKIRLVEKRKLKYGKEHTERNPKTARNWTVIGAERPTGPNNTNAPRKERSVPNAVNWDITPNAVGPGGK